MSLEKKPSTALSQEQEVGVKWNVHRGCSASQASTEDVYGRHRLSRMAWITLPAGTDRLDGCDEADELLMPMARHAAADDLAFEHAERGEQGRRAVAFVIVREGCAFPRTRLGPVEAPGSGFSRRWRPPPRVGGGFM